MSDLEKRVQTLEDQWQRLQAIFIQAPKPTSKPESTPQAAKSKESIVCPNCKGPKKVGYEVCYKCWETQRQ